ncbi:MAG: hypothetical protein QW407_06945 [Thermofilaceae archaeon]
MIAEPLTAKSFYELSRIVYRFLRREYIECARKNKPLPMDLPDELSTPEVLKSIFPDKSEKLRKMLIKTLKYLIKIREKIIENTDRIILDNLDNIDIKCMTPTVILGSDIFSTFKELSMELLDLSLSRSFAAAVQLQIKFNELAERNNLTIRLRRVGEVASGTGVASPLHMAWAWLADNKFAYMRIGGKMKTLVENKEVIKDLFNNIIRDESKFNRICITLFLSCKRDELINDLWRWISSRVGSELCTLWAKYFTELIFGIKEALKSVGFEIGSEGPKVLKSYMNACMVNYGFFEYELYSLLVNEDIPAIPKLEVRYRGESQATVRAAEGENIRELDILTIDSEGYLTQVEVTTTADLSELQRKIESGPAPIADRLIVVAPMEALEGVDCQGHSVTCIPLEEPRRLVSKLRDT